MSTQQHARARVVVRPPRSATRAQARSIAGSSIVLRVTGPGKDRIVRARLVHRRRVVSLPLLGPGSYSVRAVFPGNKLLGRARSARRDLAVFMAGTSTVAPLSSFPGPGNTGVPAGVALHPCSRTITSKGTYDSCEFAGEVIIKAAGVTISRSLIHGPVNGVNESLLGAHLVDTEIDCRCLSVGPDDTTPAIQYNDFTLTRVDIHGSGHGVAMGSNVTVEDSWIHGLGGNTEAHKDGVYVGDGTNSVIRHNSITCNDGPLEGCTAAIGLLTDFAPISHFTIDGNLLNTNGSFCFYGEGGPSKSYRSNQVTFVNNVFGREVNPRCGFYGPVTYFNSSAPGNVWENNRWADTGALVRPSY